MITQNNQQGSSPTLKPNHKMLLPMALVVTILSFGSLSFAWYKTYYALPDVLPAPLYSTNITTNGPVVPDIPNPSDEPITPTPTDELIDINDYTTVDPITGWTIYTNETVGYQISYPSDWLVDQEWGKIGHDADGVRLTYKGESDYANDYYSIRVGHYLRGDGTGRSASYFEDFDRISKLDVSESFIKNIESSSSEKVVKFLTPEGFINNSVLFLRVPEESAITHFYANTILYYPKSADELFYVAILIPPPSSEYFDAKFNNLVDDGTRYNEALQILESFKPL